MVVGFLWLVGLLVGWGFLTEIIWAEISGLAGLFLTFVACILPRNGSLISALL